MSDRKRARTLAAEAIAAGEPLSWFERLYREAQAGETVIPWADLHPNPHVVAWLDAAPRPRGARALDIGCGLGDHAAMLAARGLAVTAFDIAEPAVARARARFPTAPITFTSANLLAPPSEWLGAFDFVLEVYTLQVLPPDLRAEAARILPRLLAPGGVLLLVARGRDPHEDPGSMPWPLTRAEVTAITTERVSLTSFEDFYDDETLPVRRLRAVFTAS